MNIRTRVFIQTLSASLILIIVLGTGFFLSLTGIRNTVLANSGDLGDSAAEIGAYVLEAQLAEKIEHMVRDTALMLDERIGRIENHTRTTADIAGSLYTNSHGRGRQSPMIMPQIRKGDITPREPCLYIVPGVDFSRARREAEVTGNANEMLRQITVVDKGIVTSTINGESGYVVLMDAQSWPMIDFDPRTFDWYTEAKAAGDLYWTDVYEDPRGRGPAISCAVPFYEQTSESRTFRGVTRSSFLLSDFSQLIDSAGPGESGQLFILNRDGIKIYSSNGVEITLGEGGGINGENFIESANPRQRSLGLSMTLGASGMAELELDGIPLYAAYAPIQTLGWSLAFTVPVQEVSASALLIENQIWKIADTTKADMDRYILLLMGLIALLLIVTLFAVAFFAMRVTSAITGPILTLNDGVRELAGGNLEREVSVKTGDELEQLAVSFNMMTGRLREYIAEIARVSAEQQHIDTELDIATRIQMNMLPHDFPNTDFDLCAEVHPAKEVGGDFYDFFFIDDNHFAVIIADVSGKGIPAALFMAITKTIIKNRLQSGEDPAAALENINRQLCDNNDANMFVTVWLGVLEIESGRLMYINAGHNPPLLRRGDAGFTFLVSPPDLVLAGMDDTRYHCRRIYLSNGDTLFLYTDGIVETADANGVMYGRERMRNFLNENTFTSFPELFTCLRNDIAAFSGGAEQQDDITMLALHLRSDRKLSFTRSINLAADLGELHSLMAFIAKSLESDDCPQQIRNQIELAAEEIFVNIVRYAYDDQKPGEVIVEYRIKTAAEKVTITLMFSDRGCPFNPLEIPDPDIDLPLEQREPGGLGLLIVKKSMDTIRYCRNGEMNCIEFDKSWYIKEG